MATALVQDRRNQRLSLDSTSLRVKRPGIYGTATETRDPDSIQIVKRSITLNSGPPSLGCRCGSLAYLV
jgi:hypothetical protein